MIQGVWNLPCDRTLQYLSSDTIQQGTSFKFWKHISFGSTVLAGLVPLLWHSTPAFLGIVITWKNFSNQLWQSHDSLFQNKFWNESCLLLIRQPTITSPILEHVHFQSFCESSCLFSVASKVQFVLSSQQHSLSLHPLETPLWHSPPETLETAIFSFV